MSAPEHLHDISVVVDGQPMLWRVPAHQRLVECLPGTHVGCDTAQCGACTVLVDGRAIKSCNRLAVQYATQPAPVMTTIVGLAAVQADAALHPMQQAFLDEGALQCGYCTPGMILRGIAMQAEGVPAQAQAVRVALEGNLCRCTGYESIVRAICRGLQEMRSKGGQE